MFVVLVGQISSLVSHHRWLSCFQQLFHAYITERPRKHESEARVLIWRRTRFVRGRLITKILHLSERVTHLHIAVPTKTRFYASRIHVLKMGLKSEFHTVMFNSDISSNLGVDQL